MQIFDAAVGEGGDAFLGAVVDPDPLAVVDVVRIGTDEFDKFQVRADPSGDFVDGDDVPLER